MRGARRSGIIGLGLLSACMFESGSSANSGMLEDTDASTSSAPSSAATTDGTGAALTSGGSHGGTGGSSSDGGASSQALDGTTTFGDPSEGNPPRADLVFVEKGPVALGVHPLLGATILTLQLTNQGEAAASVLGADEPPPPLQWAGDAFPGANGTCTGVIPPGDICTVALAVGPGQPGFASGPLAVRFDDAIGTGTASVSVDLTATGEGLNLIVNPDAESDPQGAILTGWDAEDSSFHTTTEHNHGEGSLSFFGGGSENPQITQDLVLVPWSASIDGLDLRFILSGWTRANNDILNDDPHGISLAFLDGSGVALDEESRGGMTHDGWELTTFDVPIPVGTRRIRIRLSCDRNDALLFNNNCSAWFDDFFGALVYTPPE